MPEADVNAEGIVTGLDGIRRLHAAVRVPAVSTNMDYLPETQPNAS